MLTAKIINLAIALWCVLISAVQAIQWEVVETKSISAFWSIIQSKPVVLTGGVVIGIIAIIVSMHMLTHFFLFLVPNKLQIVHNVKTLIRAKLGTDFQVLRFLLPIDCVYWVVLSVGQKIQKNCTILRTKICKLVLPFFARLVLWLARYFSFRAHPLKDENDMIVSWDFILGYCKRRHNERKGIRLKLTKEPGRLVYYAQFFTQVKDQEAHFGVLWCLDLKRLLMLSILVRIIFSFGMTGWSHLWRQVMGCGGEGVGGSAFLEPSDLDAPNHHIQNYWNNTEFGNRLRSNLRRNHLGHPSQLFDPRRYLGPKAPTGDLWEIWILRLLEGCGTDFKIISVHNEYTEKTQFEWFCDRVVKIGCFIFITLSLFFFYSALSEGKYVRAIKKYGDKIEGTGGGDE